MEPSTIAYIAVAILFMLKIIGFFVFKAVKARSAARPQPSQDG